MDAAVCLDDGGISGSPLRIKAPVVQLLGQLSLMELVVEAALFAGSLFPGLIVGKLGKAALTAAEAGFPGGQQSFRSAFAIRPAAFTGRILGLQKHMTDIHIGFAACPGRGCQFFLRRLQIVAHGGQIHIGKIDVLRRPQSLALERLRQGIQVGLVHGVRNIIFLFPIEEFDGGNVDHAFLVQLLVRGKCLIQRHGLFLGGDDKRLHMIPPVNGLFQKILLPAVDGAVHGATLGIQALGQVGGRFRITGHIAGNLQLIVDLQHVVGQLLTAHGGYKAAVGGIRPVGALAGHIVGVPIGRDCGLRHRFGCFRGGGFRLPGIRVRGSLLAAARKTQGQQQT